MSPLRWASMGMSTHTRRRPAWVSALCWADVLHPVNGLASGRRACARPVLTPGPCAPCGIVGSIPIRIAPQSHPCAYRLWLRSEKDTVPSETARYRSYQDAISAYSAAARLPQSSSGARSRLGSLGGISLEKIRKKMRPTMSPGMMGWLNFMPKSIPPEIFSM